MIRKSRKRKETFGAKSLLKKIKNNFMKIMMLKNRWKYLVKLNKIKNKPNKWKTINLTMQNQIH